MLTVRSRRVAGRAEQCRRALVHAPPWVRMAVGADHTGAAVLATSDPRGLLRPGVGLADGETVAALYSHPEVSSHPELAVAAALRGSGAVVASTSPVPAAVAGRLRARGVAVVAAQPCTGPAPPLRHRLTGLGDGVCRALRELDRRDRPEVLRLVSAVALTVTAAGESLAQSPDTGRDAHCARFEEAARHGDAGAFAAARALAVADCHAGAGPGGMADALYEAAFAVGGTADLLELLGAGVYA